MELLPYSLKWFEVLLRWSHVLFAILWIGNSFLFNYLDNKLEKNTKSTEVDAEGILQHSGWFYRVERLNVAPEKFSKNLIIFKLAKLPNFHYWNVIIDNYLLCQFKNFNDR